MISVCTAGMKYVKEAKINCTKLQSQMEITEKQLDTVQLSCRELLHQMTATQRNTWDTNWDISNFMMDISIQRYPDLLTTTEYIEVQRINGLTCILRCALISDETTERRFRHS